MRLPDIESSDIAPLFLWLETLHGTILTLVMLDPSYSIEVKYRCQTVRPQIALSLRFHTSL